MKDLDAKSLARLLAEQSEPLRWRDLLVLLDLTDSQAKRKAQQLLKGMVRNGELIEDHRGAYHLPRAQGSHTGFIESQGAGLSFMGVPLARERGMVLRAGDEVVASVTGEEVHVLEVVARSTVPIVGIVRVRGRHTFVESLSPDYRGRVNLLNPEDVESDGESVAVEVVGEESRTLVGRLVEHLGGAGGVAQAVTTLLESYRVPEEWFPGVDAQLDRLPKKVHAGRHEDRRSLADLPLVTIDGESAKDFDDAVYAEQRRGGWRLVVAIADVANYVKVGSPLDQSAWQRGNSVYLPDRVIPMLPEVLSNGLCSLNPQVPRLAMVCDMKVSATGKVTGYEFYEAVIRSWQRLTYERVQEFLDEGALDVEAGVSRSLRELYRVFQALLKARENRGALDFDAHEGRLELEGNSVKAIHPVHRLEAHQLIEEAMISANVCAAEFIEKSRGPGAALYRAHEPPAAEKLEQLRQSLALAGVRIPKGDLTPLAVKSALKELDEHSNRWLYQMLVLRSLTQAVYTPDNKGHFGLALKKYMHFTSPIRRYADLVVHRTIKAILHADDPPYASDELVATGIHISTTERRAESVGWGVDAWLKCEYIAHRVGDVFDGVIMGVTDFGLFIELKGYYIQGLLHISELGSDYFNFQQPTMSLVGERSGRKFSLGDELRVLLRDVTPEQGKLDLLLDKPAARDKASGKRGSKSRPSSRQDHRQSRKRRRR